MMNTQMPIMNVASAKNVAPPTSQAESLTAEVPFNQLLSKEVSNRNNSNQSKTEAQPQARTQQAQSKPADAPRDASQEPTKNDAAAAAPAAGSSNTTAKKTDNDNAKEDVRAKKDDDEGDDSTEASEQMLALVANVGQMNNQHQQVARKGAEDNADALAQSKDGKKAIGHISAKDQQEHLKLKAEDEGLNQGHEHGKGEGELFALGGALESKQAQGKDGADGKPGNGNGPHVAGEKGQAESSLLAKNNLASAQDGAALNHNPAKFAVDAKMQPMVDHTQQPTAATVVPSLQQAMTLNQQAAVSGQAVERLTPPVGSQDWDQAVGQKVVWMAAGGMQSASLTLNPPDLGPLQVVLHVNNDQADATFITAQPEVKQALEAAMPKLREMMDAAGIQLGQATVNTGMPNQQQGANQQQAASGGASSRLAATGDDSTELHVSTVPMRPKSNGGLGLVDTFA
jgi:flagellar hook-length control protein FliK